jgi:hypothetical protein
MTTEYVTILLAAHPKIRQIWLIGSRAAGLESPNSDWDYLVIADRQTLDGLAGDSALNDHQIDLLVVYDGDHFCKPWPDGDRQKQGSLSSWGWQQQTDINATYRAVKPRDDDDLNAWVTTGIAVRVYL